MTPPADPVAAWLRDHGSGEQVVAGGLNGLLSSWERFIQLVAKGYSFTLDDYLSDLDVRDLIEGVLAVAPADDAAPARDRLATLDARLRALVVPAGGCLWGENVADEEGWTPESHWWYYTRPRHPGPDLALDLGLSEG